MQRLFSTFPHGSPGIGLLLLRTGALTQDELDEANARGHEASFVRGGFRAARV